MNLFGSTNNTTLFPQTTPINQNRTGSSFLFGNTSTQPSALTSTPFSSPSAFGAAATPSTTTLQSSSNGTAQQKFNPLEGTEKVNKNGIQTQIRTKLHNICAMSFYEKKSMEELRLEDYLENRKFPAASGLFATPTATTTNTSNPSTSFFGTSTPTPTLGSAPFGTQPTTTTSASTLGFGFGTTTTTTTASATPLTFGAPTPAMSGTSLFSGLTNPTSTSTPASTTFTFGGSQAPAMTSSTTPFTFGNTQTSTGTTTAPTFSFGGPSLFPSSNTAPASSSFGFTAAKPATSTSMFSFAPTATTTSSSAPTLNLFSSAAPSVTSTAPSFPSLGQPSTASSNLFSNQSSTETRTHLQLFQTMLNIQPFNTEMNFLAKNLKPNIGLDRTRLRTAPDAPTTNALSHVYSPLLNKPSVLTATNTTTPTSALNNHPLPNHSHTFPTVLLPSANPTNSIGLIGKRKLADSFLDDDDHLLAMDDGPSPAMTKLPKTQANKRPRVLDMNKIRSVVLGGQSSAPTATSDLSRKGEENPSETFIVKPSTDQLAGWKKFANYDAYLASKKAPVELFNKAEEEKVQVNVTKVKIDQGRAFRLPRLTHDDYYTQPSLDELRNYFNEHGQCLLKEFTVGREHYGSVTFLGTKLNVAGLDLDRLVEIERRQVTVYPDDHDKPAEGEDLNCPAIISLLGVYPIDRSSSSGAEEVTDPERLIEMNYGNYLRGMTEKFQGHFINYDAYTGTWKFRVDHF